MKIKYRLGFSIFAWFFVEGVLMGCSSMQERPNQLSQYSQKKITKEYDLPPLSLFCMDAEDKSKDFKTIKVAHGCKLKFNGVLINDIEPLDVLYQVDSANPKISVIRIKKQGYSTSNYCFMSDEASQIFTDKKVFDKDTSYLLKTDGKTPPLVQGQILDGFDRMSKIQFNFKTLTGEILHYDKYSQVENTLLFGNSQPNDIYKFEGCIPDRSGPVNPNDPNDTPVPVNIRPANKPLQIHILQPAKEGPSSNRQRGSK